MGRLAKAAGFNVRFVESRANAQECILPVEIEKKEGWFDVRFAEGAFADTYGSEEIREQIETAIADDEVLHLDKGRSGVLGRQIGVEFPRNTVIKIDGSEYQSASENQEHIRKIEKELQQNLKGDMIPSEVQIRSVGAKSINTPQLLNPKTGEAIRYIYGKRPEFPADHTMAGYGCKNGRQIDDIERLVRVYNAPAARWAKEKARYWVYDEFDEERQIEIHWYQHPDVGKVEYKIKLKGGSEYVDEWSD